MEEKNRIEKTDCSTKSSDSRSHDTGCADTPVPLAENSRIGEYRIVRKLSHNAQSVTYLAEDFIIGDMVKIQEFFPQGMARRCADGCTVEPVQDHVTQFKYFRASFMDFYRTLAAEKENPCLIPTIEIFEQNATVYVVSESLKLKTLEEHLTEQGGKESWCRAKQYLIPLCNSLANLHKKGITHQGLNPQNVLLDENMNPFLSGFSLAEIRLVQGGVDGGLMAGYSAPEQYHPERWQGSWTDVYSAAALTYHILTGKVPPDTDTLSKGEFLFGADGESVCDIPQNVTDALQKAMQPERSKRYENMDSFLQELLRTVSSNTAVFQVGDTANQATVRLAHKAQGENPSEERGTEKSSVKVGSVYLLITMVATLLVLVVGAPRLYRYFNSTWAALSRDYSWEGQETEQENSKPDTENTENGTQAQSHKVENFVGKKASDILNDSRYEQWYYFETVEEYDDSFAKGTVCGQSVPSGTEIKRKTTVTLHVSKGSESEPLPELSGKTQEEAVQILSGMGKKWTIVEGENSSVEPGQIFRTDPPAGTQLSKNSSDTVILYVAVQRPQQEESDAQTEPSDEADKSKSDDDDVLVLNQKNSDRKVIKKKGE